MKEEGRKMLRPAEIERESMRIIAEELLAQGIHLPEQEGALIRRVIHATADFDFARNVHCTKEAVLHGLAALRAGASIVTDTNMVKAGISAQTLSDFGGTLRCYMAEQSIAVLAAARGTTRASAAMQQATHEYPRAIYAIGNAPTALFSLIAEMEARESVRPALIIGVPVGFVNVVESKEALLSCCERLGVPAIIAMGRKGGSTVAAAMVNALLYGASNTLDPALRGWH